MTQEVQAVKKVGFFRGLGMMWSSFVGMIVTFFQAGEDMAVTTKEATSILRKNVENWATEAEMEFEAELEQRKAELARIQKSTASTTVVSA
jgi:hypothetical protein